TQSAPEKVAKQVDEFYKSRSEAVTVIPLENQQALLVGTRDQRTMRGIKELVAHLDRDTGGDSTLRIIPLNHLGAEEVVPLLTAIFANSGGGTVTAGTSGPTYGNPTYFNSGSSTQMNAGQPIVSSTQTPLNQPQSGGTNIGGSGPQNRGIFDGVG